MIRWVLSGAVAMLPVCSASAQPMGDHHQHLSSPAVTSLMASTEPVSKVAPTTADDLVAALDAAGIKRAVVLSMAYIYGQPSRKVENDYEKARRENDWTAEQVARFPDRLIGFCGISPLKDYALDEIERCAKIPGLRRGIKLHFGNSVVDYHNPQHVERVRRVFSAANRHRMAIVVHMRPSVTQKMPFGRDEARIFLEQMLPAAPDVVVQVAHLTGAGGYGPLIDQAVGVFADAIAAGDPRTKSLWFDVTTLIPENAPEEALTVLANRIRQLGTRRILYGSDALSASNRPREGWATFRKIPLTDVEFATIAANTPPYLP